MNDEGNDANDGEGVALTLSKPIEAHGETVAKLHLREPNGDDVIACGHPGTIVPGADGKHSIRIDTPTCGAYISRLAGIPMSSVKKMAGKDFAAGCNVVMGFFGESIQE